MGFCPCGIISHSVKVTRSFLISALRSGGLFLGWEPASLPRERARESAWRSPGPRLWPWRPGRLVNTSQAPRGRRLRCGRCSQDVMSTWGTQSPFASGEGVAGGGGRGAGRGCGRSSMAPPERGAELPYDPAIPPRGAGTPGSRRHGLRQASGHPRSPRPEGASGMVT